MTVSSRNVKAAIKHSPYEFLKKRSSQDESLPYRIVGSYEYSNAVTYFEVLLKRSTPDEIKVYDEMISDRPEFSFYSGVTIDLGSANVNFSNPTVRNEFDKNYRRQSVTWLLALARVEVNSTVSMYGTSENPFSWNQSNAIGVKEYYQVLLDDAAAHLTTIIADPDLKDVVSVREPIDENALPNLLRLKLVSDMLTAIQETNDVALMRHVEPYLNETNSAIESLVTKIYLQTNTGNPYETQEGEWRFYSRDLTSCQRMLERASSQPRAIGISR